MYKSALYISYNMKTFKATRITNKIYKIFIGCNITWSLKIKAKAIFLKVLCSVILFPGKIKIKAPKMLTAVNSSKENKIRKGLQPDFPFLRS